ncbi:hypothetical protein [Paenibacillus sp. J2TS4]|uniref:hypothetical protein n=1 Tax=Paenibacillus sp. J2TS4 TaxID=2807194 RepID=UPI001B25C4FF|nr:hypothetical protein [Paenibacillus sp. J2TS4]GIP31963.1 hypothetical protein J2TS4_11730 [Paenibacillus sp. J2TS4]
MNLRTVFGAVLLLLGAFLFLNRGETFGVGTIFGLFWPSLFVIPAGLFFHWMYFSMTGRRGVGMLVPGGVLLTAGVVCQISMLFDSWNYMWPGFILAPAVGLFELYWFGGRNKWLLIPINILTVLSILFFSVFSIGSMLTHLSIGWPIIPVAMILVGAFMLVAKKRES